MSLAMSVHALKGDACHRWTRVVVEGGHPPLVAEISTPPGAEIHPPLWDGLDTPSFFCPWSNFSK